MKYQYKKIIITINTILLLCLTAGCSPGNQMRPEVTEEETAPLIIWAWDENYNIAAANTAIERYSANHPNMKIEVLPMSQEESVAKLRSAFLTGTETSLPNIVLIEDYRIQSFLEDYEHEFVPLNDIADPKDFASYKTGVNQKNGNMYGIPFDSGVVGLFYRLDYIEAAGYSEADMKDLTWTKYIEIGRAVKEKTGKDMLTLDPSDLPIIRMMLQSAGAWYTNQAGQINFENNQALKDAITEYLKIVEADIAKPITDWNQFIHAFQSGEVASVVSGSWISASIAKTQEQEGLWRVTQLPRMESNEKSVNASSVGGSGWYVLKSVGQAEEAKKFLKETFASDANLVNELVEQINLVSTLKAGENSENYKRGFRFYGDQRIFMDFTKWTYEIPTVNYGSITYELEVYVAEAIQKILNGEDIEKALSDYQREYLLQ